MGSGVFKAKKEIMNVDPEKEIDKFDPLFAPTLFRKMEWPVLKAFCRKYKIKQKNLLTVFRRYLTHEEVHVRQFQVRSDDIRKLFLRESMLQQELAEILLPSLFMQPFAGIENMGTTEEMSFARLIVMSYIIGRQQFPDFVYLFFSIIRRKKDIPLTASVTSTQFSKLSHLLTEDLPVNGSSILFRRTLDAIPEDSDLRLKKIIRIATKYPLLFWSLQKFRRCFQRYVFGDRFWAGRKHLKMKFVQMLDFPATAPDWFSSEREATRVCAAHIIADVLGTTESVWFFSDIYRPELTAVTQEQCVRLKQVLGYKVARRLLSEAQVTCDFDLIFAEPYLFDKEEEKELVDDIGAAETNVESTTEPQPEKSPSQSAEALVPTAEERDDDLPAKDSGQEEELVDENEGEVEDADAQDGNVEEDDVEAGLGVIIHDEEFDRDFAYNVITGESRWASLVVDSDGDTMLLRFD